jgi:hypothetical protein
MCGTEPIEIHPAGECFGGASSDLSSSQSALICVHLQFELPLLGLRQQKGGEVNSPP